MGLVRRRASRRTPHRIFSVASVACLGRCRGWAAAPPAPPAPPAASLSPLAGHSPTLSATRGIPGSGRAGSPRPWARASLMCRSRLTAQLARHRPAAGRRLPGPPSDPGLDVADADEGAQRGAGLGFRQSRPRRLRNARTARATVPARYPHCRLASAGRGIDDAGAAVSTRPGGSGECRARATPADQRADPGQAPPRMYRRSGW